jgi:hypothetical protein
MLPDKLTRRSFVQTASAAGISLFGPVAAAAPAGDLEKEFASPPNAARMWTWWFWLADRVDKASITADLEEFKAKGVGGVTVYSLSGPGIDANPHGPDYMGPDWRDLFKHTVSEANRLGLGVSTMLCSGWDAGGPWIQPEHACKQYTHSEMALAGPQSFAGLLPQPKSDKRLYRDVAVFAFQTPNPGPKLDEAQQKTRNELLSWKSGRSSFRNSPIAGGTPVRAICDAPLKPLPPDPRGTIDPARIVDLTSQCGNDGKLNWNIPDGNWTVVRFGYSLTGKETSWSSPTGLGLEGDPFDAKAIELQFANVAAPLLDEVGKLGGKVFQSVQIDSWEILLPNWTTTFLEQFQKYRGYDARPYLAALAGWTVGSPEITDRFLYDFRNTIGDSIADNYFGRLTQLAETRGIIQQSEAGGVCYPQVVPMDALKNLKHCAIPMGEFWQDFSWKEKGQNTNGKQTASAAHLYGTRIAAAEAFASFYHWTDSPSTLKPTADRAFCEGLNHFFIYSSATHSGDGFPGTEFIAGTHFNRKVTWWKQARSFTDYIGRCSHILQQGMFVADVLFYNGDGCPNLVEPKHVDPALGPGYDYDVCNTEVLLTRLSVRDGRIVLPDGMSYRMLVLPDRTSIPVEVIEKLRDLVAQGMLLVGPRPETAPGLTNYPASDRRIQSAAEELWANCDGKTVKERSYKKGHVAWGITPRELLTRGGIAPDFEYSGGQPDSFLDWIHRSTGTGDIYFVANRKDRAEQVRCTFRVGGKRPELWDPVTGEIRSPADVVPAGERTSLSLELPPYGSIFVVFRKGAAVRRKPVIRKPSVLTTIAGPWMVQFDPKWGGPESPVQFAELESWTKRLEDGIKYYSGTATYVNSFTYSGRPGQVLLLDLGDVKEIAEVRLNGKKIGVAWTRPFRLEITNAVVTGENKLEIDVVNLWPNRLTGDGQLQPDKRVTTTNVKAYYNLKPASRKLLDSGLLGPVRLMTAEVSGS